MKNIVITIIFIIGIMSASGCDGRTENKAGHTKQPEIKQVVSRGGEDSAEAGVVQKEKAAPDAALDFLGTLNASLSKVAEAVKPSVVNIATTKNISAKVILQA